MIAVSVANNLVPEGSTVAANVVLKMRWLQSQPFLISGRYT